VVGTDDVVAAGAVVMVVDMATSGGEPTGSVPVSHQNRLATGPELIAA
jgi:hypothetical protein